MPGQYHFTLLENVQTMLKRIQLDTEEMGAVERRCVKIGSERCGIDSFAELEIGNCLI